VTRKENLISQKLAIVEKQVAVEAQLQELELKARLKAE
jgi:hypothetical protein